MKLKRIATLAGVAALLIAGCGAGSPTSSKEQAPDQKQSEPGLITPITGWQDNPLQDKDHIAYRLIIITTPKGIRYCALQSEMTSLGNPTVTVLPAGAC